MVTNSLIASVLLEVGKLESKNIWFCGGGVASGCQLLLIHAKGSRLIASLPLCSVLGIGHAKQLGFTTIIIGEV